MTNATVAVMEHLGQLSVDLDGDILQEVVCSVEDQRSTYLVVSNDRAANDRCGDALVGDE